MTANTDLSSTAARQRAVLVAIARPDQEPRDVDASIQELGALLDGLGIDVCDAVIQKRSTPGALGSGRLQELARALGSEELDEEGPAEGFDDPDSPPDADIVVFDGELQPGEARRMQRALGVPVFDRTQIILRVFQERAQTREAELEIELARLEYEAPRLRDMDERHGRVGGGGKDLGDTRGLITIGRSF